MIRGALVALALATLLSSGCGGAPEKSGAPRVVILGIDGFDWTIVDPLLEAGRMPVMERLIAEGTRADLLTLVPLEKSPIIWTTIATGKLPEEKGRGFLVPSEEGAPRVYTAWHRSVRAFWNILPEQGHSVSVLGWLETWPAEEIGGTMISDYVQYDVAEREKRKRIEHRTYPDELFAEIESLVVYPRDVPEEALNGLADVEKGQGERFEKALSDLRWIYAGDLTFTALAREFLRNRPEDVMAIYLRGPDAVCHKFWGDRQNLAAGNPEKGQAAIFGETVDRYFEETDKLIGRIFEEIDLTKTTVFLVSDHGFQGSRRALDGSIRMGIWMHRELGTALVIGPYAAGAGVRAEGGRVQDVLPTILHALDLPVANDMDGRVVTAWLGPEGGSQRLVRTVDTFETGEARTLPGDLESPVADEIEKRVRSLGYVD